MARAVPSTRFQTSVDGGSRSLVPLTALIKVFWKYYASTPKNCVAETAAVRTTLYRALFIIEYSRSVRSILLQLDDAMYKRLRELAPSGKRQRTEFVSTAIK